MLMENLKVNKEAPCWIVDWSSKKLRRIVRSSVAAETLSAQNGLDAIEWFQALIAELIDDISPKHFRQQIPARKACLVVDSKGFFDAVNKSCSSPTISLERRLQIDYAIAKESMKLRNILVFWTSNIFMCADPLTKLKGDTGPLFALLEKGKYQIKVGVQSRKKEKAKQAAPSKAEVEE